MKEIKIKNSELSEKIRDYAAKHKISYQKACEKLFDMGVCHLEKKENRDIGALVFSRNAGVCHPRRITRTITITETLEVA